MSMVFDTLAIRAGESSLQLMMQSIDLFLEILTMNSNNTKKVDELRQRFDLLQKQLVNTPLILQGSVVEVLPPRNAPRARPRYLWTRKVNRKTVTISLSHEQFLAFAKAIEANRKLSATLKRMRDLSETTLIDGLPGVPKRQTKT